MAILASMSLSRVVMRRSSLEFNISMDLRSKSFSVPLVSVFRSASLASIFAVTASISSFNLSSCFFVLRLRGEVSLASTEVRGVREEADRAAGPERGERPPEKKRARPPRDEEGGEDEDEDEESE